MKYIAIIPSRFASSRFPGKALALIKGTPMIQRVYQQVAKTESLDGVFVATDDMRIAKVIEESGGDVIMTSAEHTSGTSRCNEAKDILLAGDYLGIDDIIINVQGDEPFIDPQQVQQVMLAFQHKDVNIATLVKEIDSSKELFDENVVKAVVDRHNKALIFSRQPVPAIRGEARENWINHHTYLKHIGLYAYRVKTLGEIANLERSALDKAESLEQLSWIENGYDVHAQLTGIDSIGVDVPDDLLKFDP